MLEKHGIACDMMHGFNWDKWTTGKPTERLALIPAGQEHILEQDYDGRADGPSSAVRGRRLEDQAPYHIRRVGDNAPYPTVRQRFTKIVTELSRAFALCAASDEATEIRADVSFFQALQAALNKQSSTSRKTPEQIDAAIRQLVSKAIATEGQVIDVFTAAGLERQRRGTCQPRATPWVCVPIASSPEGAAQPLSRPFRALDVFDNRSQGVALGWHISPLWG